MFLEGQEIGINLLHFLVEKKNNNNDNGSGESKAISNKLR